jgi:hypothetical protein
MLFKAAHETCDTIAHLRGAGDVGFAYSQGYRIAAQAMAQRAREASRWEAGFLVFPVAFLYRHYVELMLKSLIVTGSFLADKELTPVDKGHLSQHRLDLLWNILKPLIMSQDSLSRDDIEGMGHYIIELNKVDPRSQSFRYALSSREEPSLDSIPYINIEVFVEAMERLCGRFELLDGLFEVSSDHKQQMLEYKASLEAEMRADYESEMQAQRAEYEAAIQAEYKEQARADYESEMRKQQAEHEAEMQASSFDEGLRSC